MAQQGYNKSTFCRRLIPPQLQWGYTDNLILSEKRQVLQAMSQCLLINLDEFNQISAKVQQGFLKNLIQLPNVKYKPPYGSHVQEFPRTASFIATSNMEACAPTISNSLPKQKRQSGMEKRLILMQNRLLSSWRTTGDTSK